MFSIFLRFSKRFACSPTGKKTIFFQAGETVEFKHDDKTNPNAEHNAKVAIDGGFAVEVAAEDVPADEEAPKAKKTRGR